MQLKECDAERFNLLCHSTLFSKGLGLKSHELLTGASEENLDMQKERELYEKIMEPHLQHI